MQGSCSLFEPMQIAKVHSIRGFKVPSEKSTFVRESKPLKLHEVLCNESYNYWVERITRNRSYSMEQRLSFRCYLRPNACVISANARDRKSQSADAGPVHVVPGSNPEATIMSIKKKQADDNTWSVRR